MRKLQKKINYFFKPYNGEQEFAHFMKFREHDVNLQTLRGLRQALLSQDLSPTTRKRLEDQARVLSQDWKSLAKTVLNLDDRIRDDLITKLNIQLQRKDLMLDEEKKLAKMKAIEKKKRGTVHALLIQ